MRRGAVPDHGKVRGIYEKENGVTVLARLTPEFVEVGEFQAEMDVTL
jgi:hypothetical protein